MERRANSKVRLRKDGLITERESIEWKESNTVFTVSLKVFIIKENRHSYIS